eukprot:TRINITY_DN5041_c0_g1_i1.p1 TRINITY_DN5041_c0_g1~~TRINITY_DN5041_c0_g1_i1.p1  ORF type:complete len:128 (+),score=29.01 TRINITY_DN5041_c0_g1_i1:537-920(+)
MDGTIRSLPQGLDTDIQSDQAHLTEGQKQLLAMARVVLEDRRILILDEATAALDLQTEKVFQKVLDHQFKGKRTCIIVAHRLSTIMDCDKILAMDQGKLVDFDHPQRLLSNPHSLFAQIVAEKNKSI